MCDMSCDQLQLLKVSMAQVRQEEAEQLPQLDRSCDNVDLLVQLVALLLRQCATTALRPQFGLPRDVLAAFRLLLCMTFT